MDDTLGKLREGRLTTLSEGLKETVAPTEGQNRGRGKTDTTPEATDRLLSGVGAGLVTTLVKNKRLRQQPFMSSPDDDNLRPS